MKFRYLGKEEISKLPKNSGIYAFKKDTRLLYIGKAANIQKRVKNHFQQPGYKDYLFLNEVKKIGYIKTDSEIEALILEANLIKKYQPKYNVVWKDDKNYFFVGVTKEGFPRVFWTHQTKLKIENRKLKIDYVGPFVDGKALKQTLKVLRKVFPYRSCKTLPKRPCLWYQLGRCLAPCLSKIKNRLREECQRNATNLIKILQKGRIQVLKDLKKEMKEASKIQDFEKAAKIRDQIKALEKVLAHAKVLEELPVPEAGRCYYKAVEKKLKSLLKIKREISRIEAYDISNIQGQEATGSMVTFIKGSPDKNFYRRFKIKMTGKPDDIAMIREILKRRLNHPEWGFPDLILIDGGRAQLNAAHQCLTLSVKPIAVVALAKKRDELYIEGRRDPVLLKNLPREIFNLILQLRDEAHRFAISYHKKLRERVLIPK